MANRPYILVKCAMSLDGYLDDTAAERLILSNEKDFERVDMERSKCDAILLGAEAVRRDNPRLLIKSEERRKERVSKGLPADLIKVTLTSSGRLSEELRFFTHGNGRKIVYCAPGVFDELHSRIGNYAEVVAAPGSMIAPEFVLEDLKSKGVHQLMIEGGSKLLTLFIGKGLVDELQVSIAPFFVGAQDAPRFFNPFNPPFHKDNRMKLEKVERIGDMALLIYKTQQD